MLELDTTESKGRALLLLFYIIITVKFGFDILGYFEFSVYRIKMWFPDDWDRGQPKMLYTDAQIYVFIDIHWYP